MNKEPVAWMYELANSFNGLTKEYSNWEKHVSFIKPTATHGIRNLVPLYEKEITNGNR